MNKLKLWSIFIFIGLIYLSACAPSISPAVNSSDETATTTAPTSTNLPPTPTATMTPTPTLEPLKMEDLVTSGLDYLPIQSTLDSNNPTGHIFGWLENRSVRPAAGVEIEFFYQEDGQSVSLGTDYANFVAARDKNFISLRYDGQIPDGAELSAQINSFYEEDPAMMAATLEARGEYRQGFEGEEIVYVLGELYNPTSFPIIAREVFALWYNNNNELVHFSYVIDLPRSIPAGESVPYRMVLDFRFLPSDSDVPLSELSHYELITNGIPLAVPEENVTFLSASKPYIPAGSNQVFVFGEGTNLKGEWLDITTYWAGYDRDGQVIGLFESSFLGTIFAPGETRPIGMQLFYGGRLRPDAEWVARVEKGKFFYSFSSSSDPLLSLDVTNPEIKSQDTGYTTTFMVTNNNNVEIGETQFYARMVQASNAELVMAFQGRIASGEMSDVIYAKPLAAGQSWPVTAYFELPDGLIPEDLEITYIARGK